MEKQVKVKILKMTYDRDNNLFQMYVKDLEKKDEITFAIRGTDWGITPGVSMDVINNFCRDMEGKEKNLFIDLDVKKVNRNKDGKISHEEAERLSSRLYDYPIQETFNVIRSETESNENAN